MVQQTGDCIVRVNGAHAALRQPYVLLCGIGVPKPMEGQTAVGALVADLISVAVDEQLQGVDGGGEHQAAELGCSC